LRIVIKELLSAFTKFHLTTLNIAFHKHCTTADG
jgi:hypothetical protein